MNPPQNNRRRLLYLAFWPLAVMTTILWASGGTSPGGFGWLSIPHFDKIAHFFVFGLVATLVYRTLPRWLTRRRAMLIAIAFTSLFGFADELRQSFNPDRYMEFMDWVADTAGAIVAVVASARWPFYRNLPELPLNPFKKIRYGGRYRSPTYPGIAPDHRPAR